MRFCKYCGTPVPDDRDTCESCLGKALQSPAPAKKSGAGSPYKKWIILGGVVLVAAVVLLSSLAGGGHCHYDGCRGKAVSGSDYCYSHKCTLSTCPDPRFSISNYCYTHYTLYDDDAETDLHPVYSWQLRISGVSLSSSSSYTTAEGRITNNGDKTVRFVEIKGAFKNRSGTVIDTDWTYAVGSEGLAPGESCTWRMSVPKDSSITDCDVSILDFDY